MKKQFLVSLVGAILCMSGANAALPILTVGQLTSPTCTGGTDGRVTFTVANGTSPFIVCATGTEFPNFEARCVQTNFEGTIFDLEAGNYDLVATDSLGVSSDPKPFEILPPADGIVITLVSGPPGCSEQGSDLHFNIANATDDSFDFKLSGSGGLSITGSQTEDQELFFENIPNGTFQLEIADEDNHCAVETVTIENFLPVQFTYHTLPIDCSFGTASFSIDSATGGNNNPDGYEFSVDGKPFAPITSFPFIPAEKLSEGTHALTVKSGDCLSETENLVIDRSGISFRPVIQGVSCFNGTDGSISIVNPVNAGTYSIGTFDANGTLITQLVADPFENLSAGTYIVTVNGANATAGSCTQQTVVLHQPTEIIANAVATAPTCPGSATGRIVASATGGDGNFAFTLNGTTLPLQLPGTFIDLLPGTYSLVATDNNGAGCSSRPVQIVLSDPQQMSVIFFTSPSGCNNDGALTVSNVIGGTSPYAISVDGKTFTPSTPINPNNPVRVDGLSSGTHVLRVLDTNNCFSPTIEFEIAPQIITFTSPTVADASCPNGNDGQITLLPAQVGGNGTPPFTYTIGTSGSLEKPNLVGTAYAGLSAGVYPVTVQDFNGCTSSTQDVVVSQPTEIGFSFNVISPACPGGTGTIQVTNPTGGSGNSYTFSLDGVTFNQDPTFEVAPGTYDVVVADGNSCASKGQAVVVQDKQQMGLGFTTTAETCVGCDGSLTVTEVLDGVAPFSLIIDGDSVTTGDLPLTFTGLCGGPHTLQVQDSVCVSPTVTAFVGQLGPLLLTYQVTEVTKNAGNDGKIIIDRVSGLGKGPFFFSIDGENFTNLAEFPNLVAGVYELSIAINGGTCILATEEIEVTEPTRSSIVGTKSIPATTGLEDGSLEILTETTAPLKFRISNVGADGPFGNFQNSPIFTGLSAGNYFIDAEPRLDLPLLGAGLRSPNPISPAGQGNGALGIAAVDEVPPITATTVVTPVDCNTGLGGSITIFASGGTAPFTFSLNGGAFQTSNIFTNVPAGNNLVTIQDANGHTTSLVVTVPTVRKPTGNAIFDYVAQNYCPATC